MLSTAVNTRMNTTGLSPRSRAFGLTVDTFTAAAKARNKTA